MWLSIMGIFSLAIGIVWAIASNSSTLSTICIVFGCVLIIGGCARLIMQVYFSDGEEAESEWETDAEEAPADAPESSAPAEAEPPQQDTAAPTVDAADMPAIAAPEKAEAPERSEEQAKEQPAPPPAEQPGEEAAAHTPFNRGMRYMYAMNREIGSKKAAACFVEGYEKGDLNAGYMLCHCYREGKGVPLKPAFVVQLAEYLVKRRFYPAYAHLVAAHREGRGVPMNLALAVEYSKKLEELCAAPVEGIHELVRYDALISHEMQKDEPDLRVLERLARENYAISHLPSRYSILALPLLRDAQCSASAREELRHLLEQGCQADDMGSYYLSGLLMCSDNALIYGRDAKRGAEYLHMAADRLGTPTALQSYLLCVHDEEQAAHLSERFWNACRWGVSGIKGSDELHCHISIASPEKTPAPTGKEPQEAPRCILLENKGEKTLKEAIMRVCCIDRKQEVTIKLEPLSPGETQLIHPDRHGVELGRKLYIEVHEGGRFSRMYLHNTDELTAFSTRCGALI